MTIKGTFQLASDNVDVIIDGNNIMFMQDGVITTLDGLRISKSGVVKEFPDLENDEEWKKKGLERLKEHIKTFDTQDKKLDYVKKELIKFGYTALYFQKAGFRPQRFQ